MSERTKIRLAKSEGFLFDTRTGYKVLEFGYNESGEQLNEIDADQIMQSVNKDAPRNGNSLVDFDPARSANETTAIPSEAAADKGILTEEELKERNRLLVLENDELLAENEKLKSALNGIVNGQWTSYLDDDKLRVWQTDRINPKQIALEALEELNHE